MSTNMLIYKLGIYIFFIESNVIPSITFLQYPFVTFCTAQRHPITDFLYTVRPLNSLNTGHSRLDPLLKGVHYSEEGGGKFSKINLFSFSLWPTLNIDKTYLPTQNHFFYVFNNLRVKSPITKKLENNIFEEMTY